MNKFKITVFALFIGLFALTSWSGSKYFQSDSSKGDLIIGDWQPSDERSVIRIYKGRADKGENPNKYYGRIVWLKEKNNPDGTPRLDVNNPDESKRKNKILGMVNMKDLEYIEEDDGEYIWENGTIYDPKNGSEYSFEASMSKKNTNLLNGRGYIGVSLFGRTDTWKRLKKK